MRVLVLAAGFVALLLLAVSDSVAKESGNNPATGLSNEQILVEPGTVLDLGLGDVLAGIWHRAAQEWIYGPALLPGDTPLSLEPWTGHPTLEVWMQPVDSARGERLPTLLVRWRQDGKLHVLSMGPECHYFIYIIDPKGDDPRVVDGVEAEMLGRGKEGARPLEIFTGHPTLTLECGSDGGLFIWWEVPPAAGI